MPLHYLSTERLARDKNLLGPAERLARPTAPPPRRPCQPPRSSLAAPAKGVAPLQAAPTEAAGWPAAGAAVLLPGSA